MATNFFRIKKGANLQPTASPTLNEAGDFAADSANSNKASYHNGTSASPIVTEAHTATLTNKTLSGNTATNLVSGSGTFTFNTTGTITAPNATDTLVGKATTDSLTNKTLVDSSTAIADNSDATKQIKFDAGGTTATSTTITAAQTADRTITLPDATTTLVGTDTTQTFTNKSFVDASTSIIDDGDNTKVAKFQASGITTGTTRTFTFPDADTTLVGTATTQTLTNKTLSGNTATNLVSGAGTFTFNTSGTLTAPNAADTLVGKATTDTLSNKTLDNSTVATIKDTNLTIQDDGDTTKQLKFQASGITTGTTRTLTAPDANTTIVGTDATQTLTNKTLSGNTATNLINGSGTFNINSSGTITVPNATDTLVGKATTDSFTNKTMGDALTFTQISTPSNPASGFNKVYSKSDNTLYILTSAGVETAVGSSGAAPRSYVHAYTGNGHGSTNNKIRRFVNSSSTGTAITYADSATNGGTFTINETGLYSVSYTDFRSGAAANMGISLNSSQLTTDILTINAVDRLTHITTQGANGIGACSTCWFFQAGDIVRAHTSGVVDGAAGNEQFRIVKVNN